MYVQTSGPRFETPAEVRCLQRQGDVVGMTAAHEAILLGELGIPYAVVAMADNCANGLSPSNSNVLADFHAGSSRNFQVMEGALRLIIRALQPVAPAPVDSTDTCTGQLAAVLFCVLPSFSSRRSRYG